MGSSRRSFEKNNHVSLDPWRQLARSSSSSSKLSISSTGARSSGDAMCCSHLFALKGLKEQLRVSNELNSFLKKRIFDQDSYDNKQQRLLKDIIAKFKKEKREEKYAHDNYVAMLRTRIIRLETQLKAWEEVKDATTSLSPATYSNCKMKTFAADELGSSNQ